MFEGGGVEDELRLLPRQQIRDADRIAYIPEEGASRQLREPLRELLIDPVKVVFAIVEERDTRRAKRRYLA